MFRIFAMHASVGSRRESMFKKVWLLMLAFLLVLSPVLVSADTTETDKIQSEEANETQSETDQSDSDTSGEEDDEADEPTEEDTRSEEHTSELQSRFDLVCCRLLDK